MIVNAEWGAFNNAVSRFHPIPDIPLLITLL